MNARSLRERQRTTAIKAKNEARWEKSKTIANWIAAIAIPVALAIGGYFVNLALKDRETHTKFIELAISVLASEPKPLDDYRALRKWAVDVLEKYSDVPIPLQARQGLQDNIQLGGKGLKAEVGITLTTLDSRRGPGLPQEMTFGNLVTDALRAAFSEPFPKVPVADFAIVTASSFRGQKLYPPGTHLTREDFLREMPFSNSVTLISISGSDLYKAISTASNHMGNAQIPQVSGLAVKYAEIDGKIVIRALLAKGQPINLNQDYLVATTDFDAAGHIPEFANRPRIKHPDAGRHIYDVVLLHLYDERTVAPVLEGRISKVIDK